MKKILIIDDENLVRSVINIALTNNGYKVYEADNGKTGIQMFIDIDPDIVITDVNMPEMSGIEVTKNIKENKVDADVVIMTGYGTEELIIEALRVGASNYINKPVDFKELFNILDSIILKRENRRLFDVLKDVVVFEKKSLVLDNDITKVWGTVNQILFNLSPSIERKKIEELKLGLYEILVNSIEHGNLGITYDKKKEALENNTYNELVTRKLKEANEQKKVVNIQTVYNGEELVVEIIDQGKGFNLKELPKLSDPDTLLAVHGRGILLASLYFDKLEYKEPGNVVTIVEKFVKES